MGGQSNELGNRFPKPDDCVNVDKAEAEVSSESRIDGAIEGAEANDELVRMEMELGGMWDVGEVMEEAGGGRLDLAIGESVERDVLDGCDAGQGVLLEGIVIDVVESDDQAERRRHRDVVLGHCSRGLDSHTRRRFWW
ncbi:hypothetical protein FEM48_Zijuj04G0194600 [Ziziphus jujuba var. spinosa]|uniref:Uncharacterized protein n=1 Tax=Ziziphus jujuba var. spinosa TaxID=714518 RepID=A0A978VLR3_ZIZJJ|nr:hypothetical protein FEM48_Zijuj04G0194600 [Ziziphus jujuba var. spinosa]